MNNENKEFFMNDVEETDIREEDIVLAPPTELYEEAKEIAQATVEEEKYPFTLQYDAGQKDFLQSMLQEVGAEVEADHDDGDRLDTRMNMTQLALIKRLDCVERVKTDEGRNPFLAEEAEKARKEKAEAQHTAEAEQPEPTQAEGSENEVAAELSDEPVQDTAEVMALSVDETVGETAEEVAIAAAGVAKTSPCHCPTNKDRESAQTISVESYVNGCICCPGAEQWFKFTVPQSKTYTIYTSGSLDTVGTLYSDCESAIASNDDSYGKINFRIVRDLEANKTYYVKVTANKSNTGGYTFRVTERIFASYVTINKKPITLEKGVLYELPITPNYTYKGYKGAKRIPGLSVSITPSNANEQKIWWYESYDSILDCSYGWDDNGERYNHVIANTNGTAKLYAEDWNENGKRDECTVYVGGVPVTGIRLSQTHKTISVNNPEKLTATVFPSNALNQRVIWSSSNWGIVDVEADGKITGFKAGTATITATTEDGGFVATCTVTVDSREKVNIVKEGNYFNIIFMDGTIWKSIGCDLSLDENRSGIPLDYWEYIDSMTIPEQRYLANHSIDYSAKQLAFAYLCDPLGVEYYLRNYSTLIHHKTLAQLLKLKDEVFKEIFGSWPRLIKFFPDNTMQYFKYSPDMPDADRENFHTDAEVLFGDHPIYDWLSFASFAYEVLNSVVISLLSMACPNFGLFLTTMDLTKLLFFNGAIEDTISSGSSSMLSEYVDGVINTSTTNEAVRSGLSKRFGWVSFVLDLIPTILNATSVFTPSLDNLRVYQKINSESFRATFLINDTEMSMQEFLDHCQS